MNRRLRGRWMYRTSFFSPYEKSHPSEVLGDLPAAFARPRPDCHFAMRSRPPKPPYSQWQAESAVAKSRLPLRQSSAGFAFHESNVGTIQKSVHVHIFPEVGIRHRVSG